MNLKKMNKIKVIPLGGLGEIGKNITAIEYGDEIIVIDCGLAFPNAEMHGVDFLIPDISYLKQNHKKVKAIVLTHGHEDHIGAIPYVLKHINVPIYGTKFTLKLVKSRLEERNIVSDCILNEVKVGETVVTNNFSVEFIRTCHSIADACALAITTPEGVIVHTGDFKIDHTPVDGELINLNRLSELGSQGVLLMMADSTNVERDGFTISEKEIGKNLDMLFSKANGRVIVASFASNIHRIQQIINASVLYNRKILFSGRSMERVSKIAIESGYLDVAEDSIINIHDIKNFNESEITIITTGSQGEPMSALSRIANAEHKHIKIKENDFIIISASPIPGNERATSKLIDKLLNAGAEVIYNEIEEVHVSGHACKEELKLIHRLVKPKFFMPVHGEYRHLVEHKLLAQELGMQPENIFLMETGRVLELTSNSGEMIGKVNCGSVIVDGKGVGDVGNIVLADRERLGSDGVITVVVTIDSSEFKLLSGPDILTRGFVYVRESEALIKELRKVAQIEIENCLDNNIKDWNTIKFNIKSALGKNIYNKVKRTPTILPVIIEI
ncbi:ribonuclease J [Paraclostridium bifermentans]|uniref:ribonuclease J n=1 Tax=Paraclostridium bifermentans TaxID=1490 RepID=UPI001C81850F|nr:ribonuclease J [Paraclostridium bifermentans]GIM33365.1 ribonuclease J [Paraclostridium bifermentans subsp. muricolitidis]